MNKDPEYFLQKARYFYNKAKNNIINETDSNDEFSEFDSSNDSEIYSDNEFTSNVNPIYNTIRNDNNTDDGETDYGETDNEETDYGETDNEETDYGETDNEETDYGETDYGETDYGETDYGETDYEPETIGSESEYEYIKLEPINIENMIDEKLKKIPKIKSRYTRFYDPVSKHYFGIDKIFDNKTNGIRPENKTTKTWYPENPLSYNYTRDPKTGKIYRTVKTYDDKGNYANNFREVKRRNIKKPGTTYVVPMYKS
ncbi:hypothetical protein mvi_684 [Megavirus vitis]|nr:hypothetical protein mvi_684 [Megavirus vitis]